MSLMPILGQLRNRRGNYNPSDPFSGLTPDEIRRRMEYERNNPDEFQQGITPVPMRADGVKIGPVPGRLVSGPARPSSFFRPMLTDMRARPPISVTSVPRPQPFQPQPFQPQPATPQFGQVQQQPQFNQQGMQQMMQFMQQMMQMFSMMSRQGGQGGFGGGFNQRPPMFGGGYGGGYGGGFGGGFMNQGPYGGGFGRGGYQQPQQPRQRPVPSYPRMQNNYSQGPFGGY